MTTINRRRFLMTPGAAATTVGLGTPTILRPQADTIKVGACTTSRARSIPRASR